MPGFPSAKALPPAIEMPGGARCPATPAGSGGDEEFLARLLIGMWALASGRTLRSDVRPDQLSAEELISFWADDLTPAAGRHADQDASAWDAP